MVVGTEVSIKKKIQVLEGMAEKGGWIPKYGNP